MFKRFAGLAAGFVLVAGALFAQAPPSGPAFDVATIRPAPPISEIVQQLRAGKVRFGMLVDGARVDVGFSSLADLIRIAYRVKPYQIQGPDWMKTERFEIQAKIPDGVSPDQVPEMLQALLAERFKLAIHREKKEQNVYALIVGKDGPKLKGSSSEADPPLPDSDRAMSIGTEKGAVKIVPDGKGGAVMQGGGQAGTSRWSMANGGMHLEITKATFGALVDTLTLLVDRPVVDMTELKGSYDVAFDLPPEDMLMIAQKQAAAYGMPMPGPPSAVASQNPADAASAPAGSAIFGAVAKLGLKLNPRKAPVDTIIVDHLEKTPTEN